MKILKEVIITTLLILSFIMLITFIYIEVNTK